MAREITFEEEDITESDLKIAVFDDGSALISANNYNEYVDFTLNAEQVSQLKEFFNG